MSRYIFCFGTGMALISGQFAFAQTEAPTGSIIRNPKPAYAIEVAGLNDKELARKVTYEFGQCVVVASPRRVEAAIALGLRQPALGQALSSLATSECLRYGRLRMPHELMLGAIFRAMYLRDFSDAQPDFLDRRFDFRTLFEMPASDRAATSVLLREFADCLVRADPITSKALMRSTVGSTAEKAAISTLVPKMGPCMPQGLTVKFSIEVITSLVAEVIYRNSREALSAPSNGGTQ